jgi:DNA primase
MDLRDFVDEELYPAIWDNLSTLFPEMGFTLKLGKWRSPKNLDGSDPTTRRADKTVVTQKLFHVALENGGGDAKGRAKDLITLYMEHNNLQDRIEAIKAIAGKCNLTIPEGADAKKYEEARKRREELALSYNRQKEALFSPEGTRVLRYLKEVRGYSEELIREMGLGYISPAEARTLEERCRVGIAWNAEEYPLSIAYFSRGNVMGFKFRYITPIEGKPKYMNTRSLGTEGMDNNPFGLTPQSLNKGDKKGEVIVVEGELDALHAIALGLPNVIAVAGGKITEGKAKALKKSGYKNIVILLDTDIAGQTFTAESIRTIDNVGLNSFVASLPDAKDTDEYLQSHTIEELKEVIGNAMFGGAFLYIKEREKFLQTSQSEIDFFNFLDEYYKIAGSYGDPVKREILLSYIRSDFKDMDIDKIQKGIKERVEAQAAEEENKKRQAKAVSDLEYASKLLNRGDIPEAEAAAKKALESLTISNRDREYAFLLEDNTDELWRQYKENQVGLPTKIELYHREGTELVPYEFFFPSGAVSVIGAPTNHGKSKVLQSIALDALRSLDEGETLLYITYEENELNVNKQFLNAYANLTLTAKGKKGSNLKSITEYLTEGKETWIRNEALQPFKNKEEEWKNIRRSRRIKIVKPEDNYLETLLGLIEYAIKHLSIKAIFIDYVQEIYVREWSKYSRTDELKEAMVRLDATAQSTSVPIILAAQLKRETNSPLDLYNQYIADSGWIERKASEILLIWSNKERCKGEGTEKALKRIEEEIEKDLGKKLELGEGGQLYFKLTKSRVLPSGSHAIVPINGNTGRVGEKLEPQQGEIFQEGGSPLSRYMSTSYDNNVKIDPESQKPYRGSKDEEEEVKEAEAPSTYYKELEDIIKLCDIGGLGLSNEELEKKLQELGYTGNSMVTGSSKTEKIIKDAIAEGILIYKFNRYYYKGNYTEETPKIPLPDDNGNKAEEFPTEENNEELPF